MTVAQTKKRYYVTLTPAHVDRFQALCKRLNFPPSTMSHALDDMINSLSDTFQMALDKGTMELSDLFKVMGKQLELIEADKKEVQRVPNKKRNTIPHTKKSV